MRVAIVTWNVVVTNDDRIWSGASTELERAERACDRE